MLNFIEMDMKMTDLEQLAVYIRYVLRPRRVVHFSTDHGAFAREGERLDLDVLAIDCNKIDEALCSNVLYRDWRQTRVGTDELPEHDSNLGGDGVLVLVTDVPQDGLYVLAQNMAENWARPGTRLWLMDNQLDRWITDLGYLSYIVDLDATVHAVTNLQTLKRHVLFKRTY